MVEIKLAIGSKAEKKTFKHVVSGADAEKLFGKKIGDKFHGEIISLNGYELEITGGSDSSGFPMRKDISGTGRKKIIITKGVGFNSKTNGLRKRRSLRGNTLSEDIAQINCKVIKAGKDHIAKLLGLEAPKEEKKDGESTPAEKPAESVPKQEEKTEEPAKEEPKAEEVKEAPVEEKKDAPVEAKPVESVPKQEEKKAEKPVEDKKEEPKAKTE